MKARGGHDVAVVGGGPVGAACALSLAQRGFDVTLIEAQAPRAWREQDEVDLRVLALAPSSARLLSALGVWESVLDARASPYRHMRVWDAESGAELHFDAADQQRAELGWIVENMLLQQRLWRALERAGVAVRCPGKVADCSFSQDGARVRLAGGETVDARLVVAADGGASRLREMAGIASRSRDYGQRAVVAHVRSERSHQATAWQRFMPGGPLALLPLADGRCSIVWTRPQQEAERILAMDDAGFCTALAAASDLRLGRILESTPRLSFPLRLNLARRYDAQRLVLLGDAAHVVHPLAGQGVNIGLRDVVELSQVLADAREHGSDPGSAHVLRRYARRRRSADTLDTLSIDALAHIFQWRAPMLVGLRAAGVSLIEHCGPLKRRFARHAAGI